MVDRQQLYELLDPCEAAGAILESRGATIVDQQINCDDGFAGGRSSVRHWVGHGAAGGAARLHGGAVLGELPRQAGVQATVVRGWERHSRMHGFASD